jgi:hypothetical protein
MCDILESDELDNDLVKCPGCGYSFGKAKDVTDINPFYTRCPQCNRWLNLARLRWKIVTRR